MYAYEIIPSLQKVLNKLSKKNNALFEQVLKKISEVINSGDVEHYKNLRYDMKCEKRILIGHLALVFQFIRSENKIIFTDFDHHDKVYEK